MLVMWCSGGCGPVVCTDKVTKDGLTIYEVMCSARVWHCSLHGGEEGWKTGGGSDVFRWGVAL